MMRSPESQVVMLEVRDGDGDHGSTAGAVAGASVGLVRGGAVQRPAPGPAVGQNRARDLSRHRGNDPPVRPRAARRVVRP